MKLQKYGISLERLTVADIELVRKYRNSSEVNNFMLFRKRITRKMQQAWFESIDNDANFYFIIHYESKKIGLINIKNIDWQADVEISESGLFLWDPDYIDSPAPLLASIILSEYGYGMLGGKRCKIKILLTNKKAIDFNKSLGYTENTRFSDGYAEFIQTKESFILSTSLLRKKALCFCNNDASLYLHVEPQDWKIGLAQRFYKYMGDDINKFEKQTVGETVIYNLLFDFS